MRRFSLRYLFLAFVLALLISCRTKSGGELTDSMTSHATLLKIVVLDDGVRLCQIANPWKEDATLVQYLLVPDSLTTFEEKTQTSKFGECVVIRTPLRRMMLANSCHGYLMHELGALNQVAAMCEREYVGHVKVRAEIETGRISDCGSGMAPNVETILACDCDGIFITPFENTAAENLASLPIPIIYCADYMETSPLGRAEWMKFYGALTGKEAEADSLFESVLVGYLEGRQDIEKNNETETRHSPKLLPELPYQATWYVPGGQSTMGILYRDAGYNYPWADDTHSGSLALSQEAVLAKAHDADVWVFKYYADHDYSLNELIHENPYFGQFKAAKEGNVFGCNTMRSDFYDVTPFRPDILLKELKHLDEHYFKRLE